MKRPILVIVLSYILGIIWGLYLKKTSIALIFFLLLIIYFILTKLIKNKRIINIINIYLNKKILIIFCLTSIFSNTLVLYQNYKYENLYKDIFEEEFIATVISDKGAGEYKDKYTIKVEKIKGKSSKYNGRKLILNIKSSIKQELKYGDVIEFSGEFKQPSKARNFKGFDYKEYLKANKIYGSIDNIQKFKILKNHNANLIEILANNTKRKIKNNIKDTFKDDAGNLLIGILLGDKQEIKEETIEDFKNSNCAPSKG